MKARTLAVALAAVFTLAAVPSVYAVESPEAHAHGHASGASERLVLNQGRKWNTDAPLRKAMGEMRSALASKSSAIHAGTLSLAEYRALGELFDSQLGYIVMNCKLEPAADANLHIILAELSGATDALRKGTPRDAAEGAEHAASALDNYGKYFDHPGWKSLSAADVPSHTMSLTEAIDLIGATYPGRTIAAQADPTGGEGMHYHVDQLLPHGVVAKFDVDAHTRRIYNRLPAEEVPPGTMNFADAVKKVQAETKGRVLSVEFDPDPKPHYHVNVRTPQGHFTRLDLDLETGKAAPHRPRT